MINFKRNGTKVQVEVEHGIFCGKEAFVLEINQAFEYQAQLLKNKLEQQMQDKLEQLRKQYYDKGWKEAKSKKVKKQKYFPCGWIA